MTEQPQPQQPSIVPPAPVPTTWLTQGVLADNNRRLVVITVATPTGQAVYFVTPEEAKTIAAQIESTADQLRTGLVIPVNGQMPPPPQPNPGEQR